MSVVETALRQFDQAVQIIEKHQELADFETGASISEINQAKQLLGLEFPQSYVEFLLRFGAGDFNGREFFGVIPGCLPGTSAPSAVWFTLDERMGSSLPHPYVVIGSSGYGTLFCLDTSRTSEEECIVVEWDKSQKDSVAASFGNYFLSEVKLSLKINL